MVYSEIAERLKDLRIQRGLTQIELAKMIGASKSVISAYETGVHQPPLDVLIRFAGIFGVSCDYLLGVTSKPTIALDGLTETQIKALQSIAHELRKINK